MIFKTYDSDIEGITNKLGFSKRSFAEWGEQVSSAFTESEGKMNKFKNTLSAVFVPKKDNTKLIGDFQAFKDLMLETGLSAEELSKEVGGVDSRIVSYAKSGEVGKLTTDGFKESIGDLSLGAKAGQVALKGLALVGNTLAMAFASWVATEIISWLNDLAHAEENARKRSEELTSSYETEKKNIDDNIAKYKELSEKLDDTSLSTSEVKSIKEQLLDIQNQLNEKYGAEATQIDLVNGKYDEQIKKLDTLAKKKANEYVNKNYNDIKADEKYVSEKFNVNKSLGFKGSQARPNDYSNAGFDLKKYLDRYDKLDAKVVNPDGQYGMSGTVNLVTNGTRQEVYDQINSLLTDLRKDFGKSNPDVIALQTTLSNILADSFDTDELANANSRIKKYAEAEILSNDNASKSYNDLVDAVDNYNTALKTGEGADEAKKKLLETKQAAEDSTKDITNSGKVLQDVYNSLSDEAPIEFQVEIGKNVDEDLQQSYDDTINRFKDSNKIKDFFTTEGINTQDEIDAFNDVTKGISDADEAIKKWNEHKKESNETPISTPTFSDTVLSLKDLKDQLSDLDTIMASFVSGDDIDVSNFDNIINKFTELKEAGKDIDMSSVEDAINQIGNSSSIEEAQSSLDSLCQQYINASGILDNLTESNAGFVQSQLEQIGVSNAAEIVTNSLAAEQDYLAWAKDNSAASSANLANMTSVEMAALLADANVTDEAKASMYNYWIAKGNVLDLGAITTDGDISNLSGLCSALGIATKQCETFAKAKSLLAAAVQSNDLAAIAGYAGQIAGLQASITTQISATLGSKSNSNYSPKYGGGSSTKKAYEDAAKDAKKSADKAKDNAEKAAEEARQKAEAELDAYLKYQEAMLDANEITVSQYADAVSDRLTEMFENGEISASKFYSGVETMCKKQLDIYDKVKDAVVRRYDKEIDKIQETMDAIDEQNEALNKQKDIMDKQLQYVKAMEEVEIDKLNKEKEAYEKENEAYEKQKDTMDKAVSYATTLIDKKIEKINDESDALDKLSEKYDQQQTDYQNMLSGIDRVYDDRIDELNKQSDAIQDQIDKIQDENSELDLQYRKEQALYALSKAQNQRTKKLYVKGRGIIYTQDDEAVRDAKKDLKDIETEEVVSKLNKEKQAIADQIEEVQKWKDKWSEISNAYQEKINNELLVNHFGTDYVNKILSGNITDYNDFKNAYLNIQAKIDDVSEQKKALEEELDAWNKKKDAWSKVTDAAQNEENKQAAIQQWGKDYAKIILDARQNDLQNFETNYLFINDRINDNQGAIDSLDEIINIHEQRKQNYEDLTTAMENEELKRELDRELGRTWEKDTLNASEIDWEAWKQKYLDIQDQLNNNDKLKESYEEKKNELDTWKQKWSDATSSIQNSINDQYAAQILGQNWESNIFTDRQKNLTNFTNAYVKLYQKQADAAINAANAEVTAAKNARAEIASSSTSVDNGSSTGSSSYSGGGGGGSSTPKPKERSDKYWTFQYFGGGYSSEAAAKKHMGDYAGANGTTKYGSQYFVVKWLQGCETSAIAANYVKSLRATAKKNKYNYVKRFHSGLELGRISKTNGEDFNTVQRVGTQGLKSDEVPIIAQAGEAVVTEKQIENLAEAIDYIPVYQEILDKISEVANAGKMDEVAKMIPKAKYDTPKPKEVTQNNQTINVTQDINVNCPNVTNTTGAEYLVKALRKASADVLVYNK